MKVEELKPGDKIYFVEDKNFSVHSYVYHSVHPHNKNYHILIDDNQKPVSKFEPDVQKLIRKGFRSLKEANAALIECMKLHIALLQEENKYL